VAIVFGPKTSKISLTAIDWAQPEHPVCPIVKSSLCVSSLVSIFYIPQFLLNKIIINRQKHQTPKAFSNTGNNYNNAAYS
jgi:hypothetical protein